MIIVSAQVEAEAALLDDADRDAFLAEYGLRKTGLDAVILRAAELLRLHSFFTVGPQEARSWSIRFGATAVEAAGAIHSDFVGGFIRADVCAFSEYVAAGSEEAARAANAFRSEGKTYVVRDGDVVEFKVKRN